MRVGVVWTFLSSSIFSPVFFPLSETARYRLKYVSNVSICWAVKPKKTNKPKAVVSGMRTLVCGCYHIYSKVSDKKCVSKCSQWSDYSFYDSGFISRRLVVVLNLQNSFPAGSFPRENWLHFFQFLLHSAFFFLLISPGAQPPCISWTDHVLITEAANVDAILFFSNGTFDVIK